MLNMIELTSPFGLIVNPTGRVYPNSGAIDLNGKFIAQNYTPIANAETLVSDAIAGSLPNGELPIHMCSSIGVHIGLSVAALTAVDLIPEFGYWSNNTIAWKRRGWPSIAAGIVTLSDYIIRFSPAANYQGFINLNNPGAHMLRFKASSTGVATSSALGIVVVRSASGMGNILAG